MLCLRPFNAGLWPFASHRVLEHRTRRTSFVPFPGWGTVAVGPLGVWAAKSVWKSRSRAQASESLGSQGTRYQRRLKKAERKRSLVAEPARRCPPLTAPDCSEYEADLQRKVTFVEQLLAEPFTRDAVDMEVIRSPELLHYRHRLRFELRHAEDESIQYVVFDPDSNAWIPVNSYPIASKRINQLMLDLQVALSEEQKLRWKAFQVELLSNTVGEALALIMYHRRLDDGDAKRAQDLSKRVDANIVLRARGQRLAFPARRSFLIQENEVAGKLYPQRLLESSFFQANLKLNQLMQSWLLQELGDSSSRDLLEIYCGNGNFTLPAASIFRQVLATEVDGNSLAAAKACAKEAKIENLQVKKCRAEDMDFQQLCDLGYDFSTLLLDPPRAGLSDRAREMSSRFDRVIYISCNPQTLVRDLSRMESLRIQGACLFDQFPWTEHAEVALNLVKT